MRLEDICMYVGLPVLVQLRDAMALGCVSGSLQAAPVCNARGQILLKDGTVAPQTASADEIGYRPAWPIEVRRGADGQLDFRYVLTGIVTVTPNEGVVIHYSEDKVLYELRVDADAVIGITCVLQGQMAEERAGLILPGNN